MNYKKIYEQLIFRGKNRELKSYKEKHHIIPRCLGGLDTVDNLVELTPEEHYLAHQLLVKIYPNNNSLLYAANMMIPNRATNKMYGWLRKKVSTIRSIDQTGKNNSQYGTKWICHEIFGRKKINSLNLEDYISQGWYIGKCRKIVISSKKQQQLEKIKNDVKTYREYYTIYNTFGFEKFVEITGYKYSKANLVQRFAKLLPEFVPQNGKKRSYSRVEELVNSPDC